MAEPKVLPREIARVLLFVARSAQLGPTHCVSTQTVEEAKQILSDHGIQWDAPFQTVSKYMGRRA